MSDDLLRLTAGAVVMAAVEQGELTADEASFIETYQPAGVTLFRRNIPSPFYQVKAL